LTSTMSHTFKLSYFPGRGRAEVTRLLFAAADIKYEDHRIPSDQWPTVKPTTPWGQMPFLEIDGKSVIAQSGAVARYVARVAGLAGSNPLESAQIESIHDATGDLGMQLAKARFGSEEDKKKAAEDNVKTHIPQWSALFEKHLKANNGGTGYFVGDKLSLADVAVYNTFWNVLQHNKDALKDYPTLAGLVDRVGKNERIAAWVAKRPESAF